ncbi:hypothetical protein J7E71_19035 [Mesobacillus foraminis]|uniref:hypothetical protein n=1 Tax=Mesobacillus foraminis TaxID=279826 RepID=UPI001BEB49AD|nr:hypothetical protein [Mesobacillus foraminis]MBT2757970.1 hypothetical protein [Mesobacillus foraminis]
MNINIMIRYNSPAGIVTQGGSFAQKGRTPEKVAYDWMQEIKRQVNYEGLIEVLVDGDKNITELVREMEKGHIPD